MQRARDAIRPASGTSLAPAFVVGLLTTGAYAIFALYLWTRHAAFNEHNLTFSVLITAAFALGCRSYARASATLKSDNERIDRLDVEDISSLLTSIAELPTGRVEHCIKRILDGYRVGLGVSAVGSIRPDALTATARLRYLVGAAMFLGLLGTSLGILRAVAGLEGTIATAAVSDPTVVVEQVDHLLESTRLLLGGLDQAFGTTALGIAAALGLSLFSLFLSERETTVTQRLFVVVAARILPQCRGIDPIAAMVEATLHRILPQTVSLATEKLLLTAETLLATTNAFHEIEVRSGTALGAATLQLESFERTSQQAFVGLSHFQDTTVELRDTIRHARASVDAKSQALASVLDASHQATGRLIETLTAMGETQRQLLAGLSTRDAVARRLLAVLDQTDGRFATVSTSLEKIVSAMGASLGGLPPTFALLSESLQAIAGRAEIATRQTASIEAALTELAAAIAHDRKVLWEQIVSTSELNERTAGTLLGLTRRLEEMSRQRGEPTGEGADTWARRVRRFFARRRV